MPYFYFSFSISKEKAVVDSNFPVGRGKGNLESTTAFSFEIEKEK
jgi:hypothetical protein